MNFIIKNNIMDANNQKILSILTQHLLDNPKTRFGQALFDIGINQFANMTNPASCNHMLRDIYNDTNEQIIERIKQSIKK